MTRKSVKSSGNKTREKKKSWRSWISASEAISLVSVIIAVAALGFSIHDRNRAIEAEQFHQANQAFARITISADISQVESGQYGKEITSTFHNSSPNPVFNLVLAMPKPLNTLSVSGDNYHEFQNTEHGFEIPFPTVSPGEKVEYANTYSQDLFSSQPPRVILNENFRFCFTDVNDQRWMANHHGAQRISSTNECIEDK